MDTITYSKELEERFRALHSDILGFLEPVAVNGRVPLLIEIYKDHGQSFWQGILPERLAPTGRLAFSSEEPTGSAMPFMMRYGHLEGLYDSDEGAIMVNSTLVPGKEAEVEAHETGHCVTGDILVPVDLGRAKPGTFGQVLAGYCGIWERALERVERDFSGREGFLAQMGYALLADRPIGVDLAELYGELAANRALPGYFLERCDIERANFRNCGEFEKTLGAQMDRLADRPDANPYCFYDLCHSIVSVRMIADHVPTWAATQLVGRYGTAEAVAAETPALSRDREGAAGYLFDLAIE